MLVCAQIWNYDYERNAKMINKSLTKIHFKKILYSLDISSKLRTMKMILKSGTEGQLITSTRTMHFGHYFY